MKNAIMNGTIESQNQRLVQDVKEGSIILIRRNKMPTNSLSSKEKQHNNDLTKICFNYACEDLDKSKDRCKRDKVCDMQIRKSSLGS